jgi:cytochrome b561
MKSQVSYSRMQVALHWIVVILVAAQFAFSDGIEEAWDARLEGSLPNEPFATPHAIAGILILALAVWRIALRLRLGAPALPAEEPAFFKAVAAVTHLAFYVLLIAMPVSGALAWVVGLEPPAELHGAAANILLALILLHVAGALAQRFWFRTDVMDRMSPARMTRGAKR